jgi:hypothetical protein
MDHGWQLWLPGPRAGARGAPVAGARGAPAVGAVGYGSTVGLVGQPFLCCQAVISATGDLSPPVRHESR